MMGILCIISQRVDFKKYIRTFYTIFRRRSWLYDGTLIALKIQSLKIPLAVIWHIHWKLILFHIIFKNVHHSFHLKVHYFVTVYVEYFFYRIKVYTCTIKNHTFKNLRRSDGYFIDHTASSSCWDLSCCRCEHPSCGGHCRSANQDYTPEGPRSGWQKLHRRQEDWQLLLGTDWVRVLQLDGHSAYVSSHWINL